MREILVTNECLKFVGENEQEIKRKFQYLLEILINQKIVHKDFVKRLVNTKFYELRIKTKNEYRIIILSIDHANFNECEKAVLLNGFVKKSTKDYKSAIKEAEKLIKKYENLENE